VGAPIAGQVFPQLAQGEFWKSKPPSDWSTEEVAQLTTASPWAVKTRVKMAGSGLGTRPMVVNRPGTTDVPRPPGRQSPSLEATAERAVPPDTESPGMNSSAPVAFYGEVVVSWESAAPIRLARKLARHEPLAPEFDKHYAVRITGLPAQTFMPDTGRTPVIFRLLTGTTLAVNTRKPRQSDYVLRMPEKNSILFAFPTQGFSLRPADHFVSFAMDLNQMMVRARFDLRLMTFEEAMAV